MKKVTLLISLFVIFLAGLSAQAQTSAKYRAHIPFDFNIGQTAFKAGDYEISVANPQTSTATLIIRDGEGRNLQAVKALPKITDAKMELSKLVFTRYENQYFLSEILTQSFGAQLLKSKAEKETAKKQNGQKSSSETVSLKANH